MIRSITSRDNSLLRLARAVRDGKDADYVFIVCLRLCEEALRSSLEIEAVIFSITTACWATKSLIIEPLMSL